MLKNDFEKELFFKVKVMNLWKRIDTIVLLDISDEEKWCICFDGSDVAASNII